MDAIRVTLTHPHDYDAAEAARRLEALFDVIRRRLPQFALEHRFEGEPRRAASFSFVREGKGEGTGRAALSPGRLVVEIDARYKLPWLVPLVLAEKMVRDEFQKAVDEAFG